jgi:thymidylate synthase ThyX
MEPTTPRQHVQIVAATYRDPSMAAALLIFTKSTRLEMTSGGFGEVVEKCQADEAWMMKELDYMSKTIRSSWEFLDVTFSIRNVSRACAQQITRTRFTPIDGDLFGSYAMQSQRVTDMSEMGWHNPHPREVMLHDDFEDAMRGAMANYQTMVENGSKLEDARGVLPVNLLDQRLDLVQGHRCLAHVSFSIVPCAGGSRLRVGWHRPGSWPG